jgi:hypothetical protein
MSILEVMNLDTDDGEELVHEGKPVDLAARAARREERRGAFQAFLAKGFDRRSIDLFGLLDLPLPRAMALGSIGGETTHDVLAFDLAPFERVPVAIEALRRLKALPARDLRGARASIEHVTKKVEGRYLRIDEPRERGEEYALVIRRGTLVYRLRDRKDFLSGIDAMTPLPDEVIRGRYRQSRSNASRVRLFVTQETS